MTYEPEALKETEFNGYSLFTDILNPTIRAWNRANTIYNIKERHGDVVASNYTAKFKKDDLTSIYNVMLSVATKGYENVRREIFRETASGIPANG